MVDYRLRAILFVILAPIFLSASPSIAQTEREDAHIILPGSISTTTGNFEQVYNVIIEKVGEGQLPEEDGKRAKTLYIAYQKYLIETEAKIQVLKIDVLNTNGEKQKKALDEMMVIASERERVRMEYLQRLQALQAKTSTGSSAPDTPVEESKIQTDTATTTEDELKEKRSKQLKIEIESVPEDISTGDYE